MRSDPEFIHRWEGPGAATSPFTLLLLHGTGGNEDDLLPLGRALAPGAGLLSPRGRVLERGMPRFFRRLAEGVFDEADLVRRTHELADFVGRASGTHGFDPGALVAVGFSNGANIAASLLLLRPEVLSGAILMRAMVPLYPTELPDLAGRRVLLSEGRADPIVSERQARDLADLLGAGGADVTLEWRDAGHGLVPADAESATRWLRSVAK